MTIASIKLTVYAVHNFALAPGQIKSVRFKSLFKGGKFRECRDNLIAFEFPANIATHFPNILHYLYCVPNESQDVVKLENEAESSFCSLHSNFYS